MRKVKLKTQNSLAFPVSFLLIWVMRTADNWNREQFGNIHDPQNFIKAGDFTKKESVLSKTPVYSCLVGRVGNTGTVDADERG